MTKKDYIKLAEVLANENNIPDIVHTLCIVLKKDNPLFNPDKFKKACGIIYKETNK